ncbi:tRNA-guanine transglycosylase DpdA [Mycolicibacterium sp. CR10]|uniref:tRNA-guanine transglycosylase DpdA n=1 Tax=Mycolicibacterium sp. CR10 TaxID=2562314 RepID=UPI0010BF857B|nr:tRNA-guanine transglycosylase DpdA [Mycolicibacterium sp. CR10]
MKFFFPDSQDQVSPTYDFVHDEHSPLRVRQRDDRYAHEVLSARAYDGVLVSKAVVDGSIKGVGKYSMPQRQRLYRLGVRGFLRLPEGVEALGDCGAFNYVNEPEPPYTVHEVLDFYEQCGFDAGVSVDHIILGFRRDLSDAPDEWKERRRLSLALAEKFKAAADERGTNLKLLGAAQGWDPASYADSVRQLQEIGYDYIALGGMVPLKTTDILACLLTIDRIRKPETRLHLLGITRFEAMAEFESLGVASFDSTSAFRQSFMDDRDNYHTLHRTYAAIKVPQVDGNVTLKRAILSGQVSQREAVVAERNSLLALRAMDRGECSVDEALDAVVAYEDVIGVKKTYRDHYSETLHDAPWRSCRCGLCEKHGVEMVIFRASERNKRRGFHNLSVLAAKMKTLRSADESLLERTASGR